jgi:hypothetical protein
MPQARMTLHEFREWLTRQGAPVSVDPYDIVPCLCRDPNCHGWRLVPATPRPGLRMARASLRPTSDPA